MYKLLPKIFLYFPCCNSVAVFYIFEDLFGDRIFNNGMFAHFILEAKNSFFCITNFSGFFTSFAPAKMLVDRLVSSSLIELANVRNALQASSFKCIFYDYKIIKRQQTVF